MPRSARVGSDGLDFVVAGRLGPRPAVLLPLPDPARAEVVREEAPRDDVARLDLGRDEEEARFTTVAD
ncbi:hypothetical protein [Austwickia sp. TVS 96-490-7B]|uniref:hypothetical protein n=1 Tax=Austwickia sp. TVS 96-490-7B TaxID=2830843 RepID=UPI002107A4B7|nr:hypothetical protein [Austwickia sp. TVS 96-490-7B]